MTHGRIARWRKSVGDNVSAGDVIAEIETDKATMELESADEGVLGKVVVPEGSGEVPVNEVIALLLADGEGKEALDRGQKEVPAPSGGKPAFGGTPTPPKLTAPIAKPAPTRGMPRCCWARKSSRAFTALRPRTRPCRIS